MVTKITKHILTRKECRLPLLESRQDGKNIPTFITIHETSLGLAKRESSKNAAYYIDLLEHPKGDPRYGYHFLCGDDTVWQFLPTWVRTAHSGNTQGNSSIAIERLRSARLSFSYTYEYVQYFLKKTLCHISTGMVKNALQDF